METVFIKESKENWVWGKMKVKVDDEGNKIEPYYKYDLNTNHVFYCYLSENIFEEYDESGSLCSFTETKKDLSGDYVHFKIKNNIIIEKEQTLDCFNKIIIHYNNNKIIYIKIKGKQNIWNEKIGDPAPYLKKVIKL